MFGGISFNKKAMQEFSCKINDIEQPDVVYVPLIYTKDQKNSVKVKEGDKVFVGTLLSKAENVKAVNIFSPVSGKVLGIEEDFDETGILLPYVVIQNNREDNAKTLPAIKTIDQVNLIKRMNDAGLVDDDKKPCHLKYLAQVDRRLDTLIVDCVDVDACLNTKTSLVNEFTEQIVRGVGYMAIASAVKDIWFVFSQNNSNLVGKVKEYTSNLEKWNVNFKIVEDKFPGDDPKLLFASIKHLELKPTEKPTTFGVVIESVVNCLNIARAVEMNLPVYETYISIYGTACNKNGVIKLKNGTKIKHLMTECYDKSGEMDIAQIALGSTMKGISASNVMLNLDVCTKAVIFLTRKECKTGEEMPCIYCNKCMQVCPMRLMPMWIDKALSNGKENTAISLGAETCIKCGCCSFVCPSRRQIVQRIKVLQSAEKEVKNG